MYTIPRVMLPDAVTVYREPGRLIIAYPIILIIVFLFIFIVAIFYIIIILPDRK